MGVERDCKLGDVALAEVHETCEMDLLPGEAGTMSKARWMNWRTMEVYINGCSKAKAMKDTQRIALEDVTNILDSLVGD